MRFTPDDLLAEFDRLGIAHETFSHPAVFTVEEAKRLRGATPGAHVKNLFIRDKKGRLFLVATLEDAVIDLKRLHELIGGQGRVSFASAETLREVLGVEPGSVTPFAAVNDRAGRVTIVLDARLMAHERINAHPLVNTMTSGVRGADLIAFLASTGHDPLVLPLGES